MSALVGSREVVVAPRMCIFRRWVSSSFAVSALIWLHPAIGHLLGTGSGRLSKGIGAAFVSHTGDFAGGREGPAVAPGFDARVRVRVIVDEVDEEGD